MKCSCGEYARYICEVLSVISRQFLFRPHDIVVTETDIVVLYFGLIIVNFGIKLVIYLQFLIKRQNT